MTHPGARVAWPTSRKHRAHVVQPLLVRVMAMSGGPRALTAVEQVGSMMSSSRTHELRRRARSTASRLRSVASRVRGRVGARRQPVVSVVVTVKESQVPFLEECLESLAHQAWSRLQVLVVPYGDDHGAVTTRVRPMLDAETRTSLVGAAGLRTLGSAR